MDALMIGIVLAVFSLAGAVKGVAGMGLPTVSMGLLGLALPPATAASLVILPSLVTNLWQCRGPALARLARRLWPLWLGLAGGTLYTPFPDLRSAGGQARILLGGVLVAYGCLGLFRARLPTPGRAEAWMTAGAGLSTGVVNAATGVFVLPLAPYLQCLGLRKDELVQALGLSFTICTAALAVRLGVPEVGRWSTSPVGIGALLAALGGTRAGELLRARIDEGQFRACVFVAFIAMGLAMVGKGAIR